MKALLRALHDDDKFQSCSVLTNFNHTPLLAIICRSDEVYDIPFNLYSTFNERYQLNIKRLSK